MHRSEVGWSISYIVFGVGPQSGVFEVSSMSCHPTGNRTAHSELYNLYGSFDLCMAHPGNQRHRNKKATSIRLVV